VAVIPASAGDVSRIAEHFKSTGASTTLAIRMLKSAETRTFQMYSPINTAVSNLVVDDHISLSRHANVISETSIPILLITH